MTDLIKGNIAFKKEVSVTSEFCILSKNGISPVKKKIWVILDTRMIYTINN